MHDSDALSEEGQLEHELTPVLVRLLKLHGTSTYDRRLDELFRDILRWECSYESIAQGVPIQELNVSAFEQIQSRRIRDIRCNTIEVYPSGDVLTYDQNKNNWVPR
jgi:hypothetical protein